MSRAARCGWLLVLLIPAGCTRNEQYYEVFREQRTAYKELGDILATVKDEKSMTAAKAALEERLAVCDAVAKKASALPKPPPEVAERFNEEKYLMESFIRRVGDETKRIQGLPGGAEFIKQFESSSPGLLSAVRR
jgi:hypothetical protein